MRSLPFVIALALCPVAANAQVGASQEFETDIAALLSDAGSERILLRCASLFRAVGTTAGEGTDLHTLAVELETDMAIFATMVRTEATGEDNETAIAIVSTQVRDATTLYLERFLANREATGSLFDEAAEENVRYCRGLRDSLME